MDSKSYVQQIVELHKQFLHQEFHYLKEKNHAYHNNEYPQIESIIQQQNHDLSQIFPHFQAFQNHKTHVEYELFGKTLIGEESQRFEEISKKEDFFVNFLLQQKPSIEKILSSQQKALNRDDSSRLSSRIKQKYHKGTHSQLIDFMQKEEEIYSWFLDQYIVKTNELENQFNYQKTHRAYDKIKDYVLKASVGVTSVPLGPLELASLPLWGVYFSMKEFEDLSNNFKHYRDVQKHRIIK